MSTRSSEDLETFVAGLIERPGILTGSEDASFLEDWITALAEKMHAEGVCHQQWVRVALRLLGPEIKAALKIECEKNMLNVNPGWPLDKTLRATFEDMPGDGWSELVEALRLAYKGVRETLPAVSIRDKQGDPEVPNGDPTDLSPKDDFTLEQLQAALRAVKARADQLRAENPALARAGGVALVVGGAVVIVPAASAAALLAVGFGPLGPIAGSLATVTQSVFYGAQTGGLFSILQAAGMTIVAPSAVSTAFASACAGVGAWLGLGGRSPGPSGGPQVDEHNELLDLADEEANGGPRDD